MERASGSAARVASSPERQGEYILVRPIRVEPGRLLTLRLHGRRLARLDQYGIREIEVLEGERLLQRILLRDVLDPESGEAGKYTAYWSEDGGLITQVMNFDGAQDIGLVGWVPASGNVPRYYWLWSREKEQFLYAFCLPNATADADARQIVTWTRDGAAVQQTDFYAYDETGALRHVRRIVETRREDGTVRRELYERIGDALRKTEEAG